MNRHRRALMLGSGGAYYLAGHAAASRNLFMTQARQTQYPEVRRTCVRFARDWNRQMLSYLREATP